SRGDQRPERRRIELWKAFRQTGLVTMDRDAFDVQIGKARAAKNARKPPPYAPVSPALRLGIAVSGEQTPESWDVGLNGAEKVVIDIHDHEDPAGLQQSKRFPGHGHGIGEVLEKQPGDYKVEAVLSQPDRSGVRGQQRNRFSVAAARRF